MKKYLLLLFLSLTSVSAYAQDPSFDNYISNYTAPLPPLDTIRFWRVGGNLSINFIQTYYKDWLPGGESSVANTNLFNVYANYRKNDYKWNNYLLLGYGFIYVGEDEDFSKTLDQIELRSTFSRHAFGRFWYWAAQLQARTQFTEGFDPDDETLVVSDFASPLFGFFAAGLEYSTGDDFSILFAPLALKLTFVLDQTLANAGAYGVDPAVRDEDGNIIQEGKNARWEFGFYLSSYYFVDELARNLDFQGNFWAFYSYLENPDNNVDFNLQLIWTYSIQSWLQTSLNINLFYDNDFGSLIVTPEGLESQPGTLQIKEVFTLGIALKF